MMKPKIRFNGFTDDWEQRKLEEIYQNIGNAFVGTATPYYVDTGHFYLESNNIKDGQINRNNEVFINDEFYERQKDKWLHTGDMVMVQSGHVGHTAVIPEELDNSAAHALIMFRNPKIEIEPYFLNYQYQTIKSKRKINNITTGNTIKHILASDMYNFIVDVSDIEEQQQIANYFLELDHLITLHQRKCDGLKKLKKYMLQNMFPQNGEKTPKIRFQGFINAWEQRKLGDVAQITMGQSPAGSTYSDVPSDYILVQGNADLENGWVKPRVWTTQITKQAYIGDLIMSVRAPAGAMGKTSYNAVIGRGVAAIKGNEFIYQLLVKMDKEGYWKKDSTGSTFESLNSESIKNAEIKLPSNEEQTVIGTYFEQLDHLITLHQRKYNLCNKVKVYAWEQRKLGELTIYRNGTGHEEKQSESGKYELINLNSISIDGGLKPSGKFIDEETETLLKDDLVMVLSDVGHGDLLGRVAIIPENNRFVLNQRVALLRNNSSVDIKYLFSYINAHQIYFKKQGAGSSQLNISRGSVENFEVLLPHKDEQKKIGKYLSSIDNLITLHQRKVEQMKNLKKYMLQNMFPAEK